MPPHDAVVTTFFPFQSSYEARQTCCLNHGLAEPLRCRCHSEEVAAAKCQTRSTFGAVVELFQSSYGATAVPFQSSWCGATAVWVCIGAMPFKSSCRSGSRVVFKSSCLAGAVSSAIRIDQIVVPKQ
jgi:hypothetical protein